MTDACLGAPPTTTSTISSNAGLSCPGSCGTMYKSFISNWGCCARTFAKTIGPAFESWSTRQATSCGSTMPDVCSAGLPLAFKLTLSNLACSAYSSSSIALTLNTVTKSFVSARPKTVVDYLIAEVLSETYGVSSKLVTTTGVCSGSGTLLTVNMEFVSSSEQQFVKAAFDSQYCSSCAGRRVSTRRALKLSFEKLELLPASTRVDPLASMAVTIVKGDMLAGASTVVVLISSASSSTPTTTATSCMNAGLACTVYSNTTFYVTLTVTLPYSVSQFDSAKQVSYRTAIASAAATIKGSVDISKIYAKSTRRHWLVASVSLWMRPGSSDDNVFTSKTAARPAQTEIEPESDAHGNEGRKAQEARIYSDAGVVNGASSTMTESTATEQQRRAPSSSNAVNVATKIRAANSTRAQNLAANLGSGSTLVQNLNKALTAQGLTNLTDVSLVLTFSSANPSSSVWKSLVGLMAAVLTMTLCCVHY